MATQVFSQAGSILCDVQVALEAAGHPIETVDDCVSINNLIDAGDEVTLHIEGQPKLAGVLSIIASRLATLDPPFSAWQHRALQKNTLFTGIALAYSSFEDAECQSAAYEHFEMQVEHYVRSYREDDDQEGELVASLRYPFILAKVSRTVPPSALRDYCLAKPIVLRNPSSFKDILPANDNASSYIQQIKALRFGWHIKGLFIQELLLMKLGDKIREMSLDKKIEVLMEAYSILSVDFMRDLTVQRFCWEGITKAVLSLPENERRGTYEHLRSVTNCPNSLQRLITYKLEGTRIQGWTNLGGRVPEEHEIEAFIANHPISAASPGVCKPLSREP